MGMQLSNIKALVKKYPVLNSLIAPGYRAFRHLKWLMRRDLVRLPLSVSISGREILMIPEGAIPEVIYKGDFESVERDFVSAYVQPGMIVVDAGANVGLYSLISSVLVGEAGRVYSFEPSKLTYQRLVSNLALNGCRNVFPYNMALSNVNGTLVLGLDPAHPDLDSHRFVRTVETGCLPQAGDESVDAQLLDVCFKERGLDLKVDFLKIDVEGAELQVLRGAEEILSHSPNIAILLECTKNREEVRELLEGFGLSCFVWDVYKSSLVPAIYHEVIPFTNVVFKRA